MEKYFKHSLALFRFYAKFHFLPIQLEEDAGLISSKTSPWSRLKWKLMLTLGLAHITFLDVQLVRSILMPQHLNLTHFPLHFVDAFSQTLGLYFTYKMFSVWEDTTVKIFNHVMEPYTGKKRLIYWYLQNLQGILFPM